jgi:hypothetical protein
VVNLWLAIPITAAVGTSSAMVAVTAPVGFIGHLTIVGGKLAINNKPQKSKLSTSTRTAGQA